MTLNRVIPQFPKSLIPQIKTFNCSSEPSELDIIQESKVARNAPVRKRVNLTERTG
jgi:hypothetical protein